jgi:tetraacyldisaccharide-1-P 4'-kinase
VSGIARPEGFADGVRALGVEAAGHAIFPDHYAYTLEDARAITGRCRREMVAAMITTEKDWVKLERYGWAGVDVWVARLEVVWVGEGIGS